MVMPISKANVKILPLAISVAYPFFIAIPDMRVPIALKTQKTGIVTNFIIIGPTTGIVAINTPTPTNTSVNTLRINAAKTNNFLSIP